MCDPVSAGIGLLGSMLMGSMGGKSDMPSAPNPEKPPQAAKAPERDAFAMANRQSALTQGPASTMLTGAGGVPSSGLSLGRTSLYDAEKKTLGA